MKLKGIKGIVLLGVVALVLTASIAVAGILGDLRVEAELRELELRDLRMLLRDLMLSELISEVRVWYVGCGKDNPLYLAVLDRLRGLGVIEMKHLDVETLIKKGEAFVEPQDALLIVFDSNWLRDHVFDKDLHRLLQDAAPQMVSVVAVGGDTSTLFAALGMAGVYPACPALFPSESGVVVVGTSAQTLADVVGFRNGVQTLPDGRLNFFPRVMSGCACCPCCRDLLQESLACLCGVDQVQEMLIEFALTERLREIWPDGEPLYVQRLWRILFDGNN